MGNAGSASDELRRWKDKYFELQESLEEQEKDTEAFRSVLQRMLLRLCLSAEGQSAQFDDELKRVRADVRKSDIKVEDLADRLNELDAALSKVDAVKSKSAERFAKLIREMSDLLESAKPPRSDKAALKKVSKLVRRDTILTEQYLPVLEEFAEVQKSVITWMQAQAPSQPGLMSRIFGGASASIDNVDQGEELEAETSPGDELEIEAETVLEEDEVVPGFAAISVHVRNTLNHLLEQLTFPQSSQRALRELKDKISGPLNWYELGPTLDDLSNVVISAIGRGQRDFGSFLSDIDERLQKIQTVVLEALQADESLRAEELEMDRKVRTQISSMTASLEQESDLEGLKSSIKSQVDSISQVLDHFAVVTQRIQDDKAKDYEILKAKFDEMEQESRFFRQRLKEERSKALTDALTKLPNREAYDERFSLEYERWKRYRKPTTMVVADVDHFKSINDEYGHLSGDKVLQILAKELQSRLRKTDFIARYGGEEFVFLLPETDLETAQSVMNKTREMIARLPFHFRDEKVQVTVSFGMVAFAEGLEAEDLFELADKALYQAKANGRNRVELASP